MKKFDDLIYKCLCAVCGFLMVAMMSVIFAQVVARYAFQHSLSWSEEIGRYIFVWITFLGMVLAYKAGAHVALDLLLSHMRGAPKKLLKLVNVALVIVLASGIFISALALFELGTMQESPALELPMHWVYSVIPVSGILLLYYALRDFWACLTQREEDKPC
ncbi:MAG: TRAP transporter small permease [Mailhella sp.]|nr:TRAP transporter small permease [Mailhella sp.]